MKPMVQPDRLSGRPAAAGSAPPRAAAALPTRRPAWSVWSARPMRLTAPTAPMGPEPLRPSLPARLLLAFAGSFALTLLPAPRALLLALLLLLPVLLLQWRAAPELRQRWLRRGLGLNLFMAFTALALWWQPGGPEQALLIALRANAVLWWTAALLAHCDESELARASLHAGCSPRLATLLLLMLRARWLLQASWQRVERASRARAFHARPGLQVWRVRGLQLAWWLEDAMQRATAMQAAMKARAFGSPLRWADTGAAPGQPSARAQRWLDRAFVAAGGCALAGLWWLALA